MIWQCRKKPLLPESAKRSPLNALKIDGLTSCVCCTEGKNGVTEGYGSGLRKAKHVVFVRKEKMVLRKDTEVVYGRNDVKHRHVR